MELGIVIDLNPVRMFSGTPQASNADIIAGRHTTHGPVISSIDTWATEDNFRIATIVDDFFKDVNR